MANGIDRGRRAAIVAGFPSNKGFDVIRTLWGRTFGEGEEAEEAPQFPEWRRKV